MFIRYNVYSLSLTAMCQKCKELKSCSITDFRHIKFLRYYFDVKLSKCYMNEFTDRNDIKHNMTMTLIYLYIND